MCSKKRLGLFWIGQGKFFKSSRDETTSIGSKILFRKSIEQLENEFDSSIGSAIQNSSGLSMTKIIESGNDRTEITLSTSAAEEKQIKCINMWKNHSFFGTESYDFSIEKANIPENAAY